MKTLEQTLVAVEENLSSIFTKEDVISLLNNIKQENEEDNKVMLSDQQKEDILSEIMQSIEYVESDIVDKDNVRFEVDSTNYITIDSVDVDFNVIRHAVKDVLYNLD